MLPLSSFDQNPDVFVVGGGSAGVAAAIASARAGAKTLLVEHFGQLGGAGTASLVHSFCGLYDLDDDQPKVSNRGLPAELEQRLRDEHSGEMRQLGRVHVLMHSPVKLAAFYDRWCAAEPNLTVLLHTDVIKVQTENDQIVNMCIACRGTVTELAPRAVVDASGDAIVAALAGQPFEMAAPEMQQRAAYVVAIGGTEADALAENAPLQLAARIAQAVKAGKLPVEAMGSHFRSSVGELIYLTIDLPCDHDATMPSDLSKLEVIGRKTALEVVDLLRAEHSTFAASEVVALPARAGVRESRRWVGEVVLTEDDILECRTSESDVARASWPLELRENARGPKIIYPRQAGACGIPLGALRPARLRNVFTAGRCISTTHRAQASTRVMGTALATGQAAGLAAAIGGSDTSQLAREVRARLA